MSVEFTITAEKRDLQGKGASRRLRRVEGKVPAILYGKGTEPTAISVAHKELVRSLTNEAFYSHILTLQLEGKDQPVILKDLQRHPFKPLIMHADFQRVNKDQAIHVNVPLHFLNEEKCVGVRMSGGSISHMLSEVEVVCLPSDLPEFINVDMEHIDIDSILHLSDLVLAKGIEIAELAKGASHDLPVVSVQKMKVVSDSTTEDAEPDADEPEED